MEAQARTGSAPSARERDVLELIARGRMDKEIANELGVALPTVRVYRQRLLAKLGTKGSIQTVLVGWRRGYIDLNAIADDALTAADERLGNLRTVR